MPAAEIDRLSPCPLATALGHTITPLNNDICQRRAGHYLPELLSRLLRLAVSYRCRFCRPAAHVPDYGFLVA